MYYDLTRGKISRSLILFALPMMAGNLLQQFYNIADTLIVGRVLGSNVLAAVGSSYTLMTFLTSIFLGLSMGAGALFSKLATTSSTGGLLLALQRAIVTARPKGRYRKHFCWPAIKRYYSNLLVSILLLALLYTFELLHLLYCQSFQHNIL